jgi:hypothetical protein
MLSFLICVLCFAGCGKQEEPAEWKELHEIESVLGQVANDYLNAKISKDEADEKLDMLGKRLDAIEDYFTFEEEDTTSKIDASSEYLSVEVDIISFKYNLFAGEITDIKEIKSQYYKK